MIETASNRGVLVALDDGLVTGILDPDPHRILSTRWFSGGNRLKPIVTSSRGWALTAYMSATAVPARSAKRAVSAAATSSRSCLAIICAAVTWSDAV